MKKDIVKLGFLAGLLAALAIYVIFVDQPATKVNEKNKNEFKKLFNLKEQDIVQFTIQSDKKAISCMKKDKIWLITSPKQFATDKEQVKSFKSQFINLRSNISFKDNDLAKFGLDKSIVSFVVESENKMQFIIYRGNKTPDGKNYYVKTDKSNEIHIISESNLNENGLNKSLTDLRDKDFLKIKEKDLIGFTINDLSFYKTHDNKQKLSELPPEILKLDIFKKKMNYYKELEQLVFTGSMSEKEKTELKSISKNEIYKKAINNLFNLSHKDKWAFYSHQNVKIVYETSDILANDMLNIKAKDFIENKKELRKISFEKPLNLQIKTKRKVINLQMVKHEKKAYVKVRGQKSIYEVPAFLYDSFSKKKEDYLIQNKESLEKQRAVSKQKMQSDAMDSHHH